MPKKTIEVAWSNSSFTMSRRNLEKLEGVLIETFYYDCPGVVFAAKIVPNHTEDEQTFKCGFCREVKSLPEARYDPTDDYNEADYNVCARFVKASWSGARKNGRGGR